LIAFVAGSFITGFSKAADTEGSKEDFARATTERGKGKQQQQQQQKQ
jgi:hypothetical protein